MIYLVLALYLALTGCLSQSTYNSTCDITQPDKQGTGYTVGTFPCKLVHHEGKQP